MQMELPATSGRSLHHARTLPLRQPGGEREDLVKRGFDLVFSAVVLILLTPAFLLIAIVIAVVDPGPVFFRHRRIGKDGRTFECLKFRTMVPDAEQRLERYLAENPEARREWLEDRKLRHDPRVTPVGHFLRRSSLDELPQFFNVLRGEMSVVGPRPIVEQELEKYGDVAPLYLSAKPGITGLWQVSGRNDTGYGLRVALDRDYVLRRNMLLDLRIVLSTMVALAQRRGSY